MKQIISFNEHTIQFGVVKTIADGQDALKAFRDHLVERTMALLKTSKEEAEKLVEDGFETTDDVSWYVGEGGAFACIIGEGDCNEYIELCDVPEPGEEARELGKEYDRPTGGKHPELKPFTVTMNVEGQFKSKVWAKDGREAEEKMSKFLHGSDLCTLEDYDAEVGHIEDEDGNLVVIDRK